MSTETEGITRHCAFCLTVIRAEAVKRCSGCGKRAYCSKKCQKVDWRRKGKGQGHKNWCSLECGEEDVDWEVVPFPGKGIGLIAKRKFPKFSRIIVECIRPKDHPGIMDLMPINGTFEQKFQLNGLGNHPEESVICLRMCRANHMCHSNAGHTQDKELGVKILFSRRDIEEGEEITISYTNYKDVIANIPLTGVRQMLKVKYGIICPEDCFCYDEDMKKIMKECRDIDSKLERLARFGSPRDDIDEAFVLVNQLLTKLDLVQASVDNITKILNDAFQLAIMRKKTVREAKDYLQQLYNMKISVAFPSCSEIMEMKKYLDDIQSHPQYGVLG